MSDLLDSTGKVIETIPELYSDGLKPTVQESGKAIALIPKAINAALVPLRKWIAEREYCLAETEKLLEKKLENVPVEKITTPEGYVGVPALQAIAYSMDSDELRELYANLLAKAMNVDTKNRVHPSFVELIKQMSPNDAKVFKTIYESPVTPVIDLYISHQSDDDPNAGSAEFIYNVTWIDAFSYEEVALSLDNLIRLGLIEIPSGISYTHKENYDEVKKSPEYIRLRKHLESLKEGEVKTKEKYIRKTILADSFFELCVK